MIKLDIFIKKVELEGVVNVDTIKQEIEEDKLSKDSIDDDEVNPCHNIIVNNFDKKNVIISQMKQWSILSNVVNYVQYNRNPKNFYHLDIRAIDQKSHRKIYERLKNEDRQILDLDLSDNPDKLRGEYLDMSEGISTTKFDENSDLRMTYIGRIDMAKASKFKAEEKFPISEEGHTVGKLLDGTKCQILLDTGAGKSFMSTSHYLRCKSLHLLPKFASKTQRIKVGNGKYISVLFIIPIVIDIHDIDRYTKTKPPMTVTSCRSFMGMVNFLSLFCPEYQKLLKPICDLTRKGRQFMSGEEQLVFEEIKSRFVQLLVLYLPDCKGRFNLYSDTS